MAKISEVELEGVKELRERICDLKLSQEFQSPKNLVRFLRARNYNLEQVEDMIRKHVSWYETQGMDCIMQWEPADPNFKSNFPWQIVGFDNLGGPLIVLPIGKWNPDTVVGKREEFVKLCSQYFETVWSLMKIKGKGKEVNPQFTIIIDLQGLGWRHYTTYDALQGVLTMVKCFEANYPDTLRLGVFVNAPSIFGLFWKLIKPAVSDVTYKKLHFLGSDKKLWTETICKYAKVDDFPEQYGGNLEDDKEISLNGEGVFKYVSQNANEFCAI